MLPCNEDSDEEDNTVIKALPGYPESKRNSNDAMVGNDEPRVQIDNLPDEILENIFLRISPYKDLDSVKIVCKRWNRVANGVIATHKLWLTTCVTQGDLVCDTIIPTKDAFGKDVGNWISGRFGHGSCYYDKNLYVVGGTTHASTTFNDLWKFDLSKRSWSRIIPSGDYPAPKTLASCVQYKNNLVYFGGWTYAPLLPMMEPWRFYDELHMYNFSTNKWSHIITSTSPFPCAGHSASIHSHTMVVFGGRIFDKQQQAYLLSNEVWIFDFDAHEWFQMHTNNGPAPAARYGQTQIQMDDNHALIVGGCGGPNQIFSDVWLLNIMLRPEAPARSRYQGTWKQIKVSNVDFAPSGFHYSGCRVGHHVVFCECSSPVSPFLAFMQSEPNCSFSYGYDRIPFEASPRSDLYFHSKCSSGLKRQSSSGSVGMGFHCMDISQVLTTMEVFWTKEPPPIKHSRPHEKLLYSMVAGRAELILFGGFFKEPNGFKYPVSNEVLILKPLHKSY